LFASSEFLRSNSSLTTSFDVSFTVPRFFCPRRDITRTQPLFASAPKPSLRSVLRFSQPPDVFLRIRACRLIPSRSHVQGHYPFRGILSARSHHFLIGRSCPRRWTSPRSPAYAGWPHDVVLDFEALIRARPRSTYLRYSQRHVPLPSSGPSPPGTDSPRSVAAYPRPPLTTFTACTFAFAIAPAARPQRISREEHDGYVTAPPACSSFRAVSPNPPCDLSTGPSARLPA